MNVPMKRETVKASGRLRAQAQQVSVEAEAALPGGLRDEVLLFYTEAQALPLAAEAVGDRVNVTGRVAFRALYSQGDLTRVRSVEESRDFSRSLSTAVQDAGAVFEPVCEITAVSARVFNGRILMKAELNVSAEGVREQEISVVSSLEEEAAQVLSETVSLQRAVGSGDAQGLIKGEFEISPALQAEEALLGSGEARVEARRQELAECEKNIYELNAELDSLIFTLVGA